MKIHRLHYLMCALLAPVAAACGGDGNDVDPELIPGGGVTDPGIDGELNVHVIDEDSDEPIAGAAVHVGDEEVETDADGLAVFTGVSGPQTITVIASGHVASTWVGVDGANVTIPVGSNSEAGVIDEGTVMGTIDGWPELEPPANRGLIAFTGYTRNDDDEDPANDLEQPTGDPAPNTCFALADSAEPCDWSLRTRTGQMAIVAFIGDAGVDMSLNITDFAYATGVVVEDGETVSDVTLTLADRSDLTNVDLTLPSPPNGTDTVQALIEMDLGDDGRLLLPQFDELTVPVPDLALFPGASYGVLAIAGSDSTADDSESVLIVRELTSLGGVDLPDFLPLPGSVSSNGTTFEFEAVADASVHTFEVRDADDDRHWAVAVFDGSTAVELPEHVSLPTGELTFEVQAIEIPELDVRDFTLENVEDQVSRVSSADVAFN